jgi:putative endopeptidase
LRLGAASDNLPAAKGESNMQLKKSAALAVSVLALASAAVYWATPVAAQGDQPSNAQTAAKPVIGTWGFDVPGINTSVKPGDDFSSYAGGNWEKANPIPADRTRWGTFDMLRAKSEEDQKAVIQGVAASAQPKGSAGQKVADMYNSYMDTDRIEKLGLKPVDADLKRIAKAKTHDDIALLMAEPELGLPGPVGAFKGIDQKDPDRYSIQLFAAGLGLPTRDYYLKTDEKFVEIRGQYQTHIETMLNLAKIDGAKEKAAEILALDTKMAALHWPQEKNRNRDLTYNPKSQAELKAMAPEYPWDVSLKASGLRSHDFFVVAQVDAVQGLAKLFKETPVPTWQAYLQFRYLSAWSDVLPKAFDEENFAFYGKILSGQPQQRDRWKRAVGVVNGSIGEAVGQIYVAKHFPADSKAKMNVLVENLKDAYRQRIRALTWMTEPTKLVALKKVDTLRTKIGYPDKWIDYSALSIEAGDAVGNRKRSARFDWNRDLESLSKPTDRDEWFMTPQTVNAYYNPQFNEIVFPAAILQAPFFDPNADLAVNYGGIGGVIGHEIGHGFDDQGAKSDERGVLRTWWSEEDVKRFKVLGDKLAKQYDGYSPLPGLNINGRLALGENIGDLGGLGISYVAYKNATKGQDVPVLDGFSGEQRFFLGWAQVWRASLRDEAMRNQILQGPHSPPKYRINGVVPNIDAWYDAFGVKKGEALFIPKDDRVKIW